MDYITSLILQDIVIFDELAIFTVICRLVVLALSLEFVAVVISHVTGNLK